MWLNDILQIEDAGLGITHEDVQRMAHVLRAQSQRMRLWLALGRITEDDLAGLPADAKELIIVEMSISEAFYEMQGSDYSDKVAKRGAVLTELARVVKLSISPKYEDGEWNFISAIDNLSDAAKELLNFTEETNE